MLNGAILKDTVLFMANHWNEEMAVTIFGKVMGEHFWRKWLSAYDRNDKGPDYATMQLFYEMTVDNLNTLVNYAIKYYNHD